MFIRLEQHIVDGAGIERRIEIDEIDALVLDVIAQDIEIVAVEQRIGGRRLAHCAIPLAGR